MKQVQLHLDTNLRLNIFTFHSPPQILLFLFIHVQWWFAEKTKAFSEDN